MVTGGPESESHHQKLEKRETGNRGDGISELTSKVEDQGSTFQDLNFEILKSRTAKRRLNNIIIQDPKSEMQCQRSKQDI